MKPPVLSVPHLSFPPLWILEGPDAAGKSTLAQVLQNRLDAFVVHGASMGDSDNRVGNDEIMRRYHCSLIDIITRNLAGAHAIVCDRLWLSHVIYARARNANYQAEELLAYERDFMQSLASLGARYIFAIDDSCIANHERHRDADHPYDATFMVRVLGQYQSTFAQWSERGLPVTRYSYTTDGKDMQGFVDRLLVR